MKKLFGNISTTALILLLIHSSAHSQILRSFNLPDTGQTSCYNTHEQVIDCANTGQDGEFSIYPLSYTDNGNYTVTDNNTGLIWEKCTVGQNNDLTCSGTASSYLPGNPPQTVCGARTTGGHNDWRTPSKKELITILNYSIASPGPAIMTSYFPSTKGWFYCTSTTEAGSSNAGWYISFQDGEASGSAYNGTSCYLRCVRGTQTLQSLQDNGNETVTDQRTGLMWQKCSAGQNNDSTCSGTAMLYTWTNALSYCNNLVLPTGSGYADWRLPNVKELESLTDDAAYNPAIDLTVFPNTQSSGYLASTTDFSGVVQPTAYSWGLDFSSGTIYSYNEVFGSFYVRCVRGIGYFVRLFRGGNPVNTYSSFNAAYNAAVNGDIIQAQAMISPDEDVLFASPTNINISLIGGYDGAYASVTGFTTLTGSLTVSQGSLQIANIIIQ